MKSEVLPSFEAFMAEPETAFKLYLEAVKAMESFAEMKSTFEHAAEAIKVAENLRTELATEKERNSRLQFRVLQLERLIYGRRSEKLSPAELNQLRLDIQAEEIASSLITDITDVNYKKVTTVTKPKAHPGRNLFPAHLRREEVVLQPFDYEEGDVYMGDEVTETLEYTAGEIWVKRTVRQKYVKKQTDGSCTVKIADLPVQTIDKCIAGASLLAYIVVSKYIDSLPLYRQIEMFKRIGVDFPSSTVSNWITKVCELLYPLYELLKKEVLKAEHLNVDETTMKVIDKAAKKGETHKGWYWVYLHHWGKLVFFDYKPTRAGEVPESMLKDYKGSIQADGYAVYEGISKRNGNVLVCCMAHVRRKFEELYKNNDPRAGVPLQLMNELFGLEEECRIWSLSFEQVEMVRYHCAIPILKKLEAWLRHQKEQPDNDAPMVKAINYALNRWDKLTIYVENGRYQLDNNSAERAIRIVAINRKNSLFSGSHEGAQRSAMLFSLTASCKLNGVNPMAWLTDVLERLPYLPKDDKYLELLLPNNWQPKPVVPSLTEILEN
ncbi:transposase [Pedobacter sp. AK017]|uniref:IS66 family transposase n=1 Tax=Pedobacter sp. AK017 TaxID=2723073 RepID=UPI00161396F2|nr:IS66 family transposase [Pedobacter sp. AK017]MBB5440584.1 transposase [Pedobacter sp. AK017]